MFFFCKGELAVISASQITIPPAPFTKGETPGAPFSNDGQHARPPKETCDALEGASVQKPLGRKVPFGPVLRVI